MLIKTVVGATLALAITAAPVGTAPAKPTVSTALITEAAAQSVELPYETLGLCQQCGKGELALYDSNTSDWGFVELIRCQKGYTDHMDEVYERVIRKTYKCTACKAMDHVVMTQEKTTCIAY